MILRALVCIFVLACGSVTYSRGDGFVTSNPYAIQKKALMPYLNSIGELTLRSGSNDSSHELQLLLRRLTYDLKGEFEDPNDFCTGFLVTPDIVNTAAHCMEENGEDMCPFTEFRLETNPSCGAPKYVFFQSACAERIWTNPLLDQALFRLKKSINIEGVKPIPYHMAPFVFEKGQVVFVLSLYRDGVSKFFGAAPGHINACTMTRNEELRGQQHDNLLYEMDCEYPLKEGESGSPILNEQGEVIGIITAGVTRVGDTWFGHLEFRSTLAAFSATYRHED